MGSSVDVEPTLRIRPHPRSRYPAGRPRSAPWARAPATGRPPPSPRSRDRAPGLGADRLYSSPGCRPAPAAPPPAPAAPPSHRGHPCRPPARRPPGRSRSRLLHPFERPAHHRHAGAFARQRLGDRPADALARRHHERRMSDQAEVHATPRSSLRAHHAANTSTARAAPSQCTPATTAARLNRPATAAPTSVRANPSPSTRAVSAAHQSRPPAPRSSPVLEEVLGQRRGQDERHGRNRRRLDQRDPPEERSVHTGDSGSAAQRPGSATARQRCAATRPRSIRNVTRSTFVLREKLHSDRGSRSPFTDTAHGMKGRRSVARLACSE